jgi:hypothetical protein
MYPSATTAASAGRLFLQIRAEASRIEPKIAYKIDVCFSHLSRRDLNGCIACGSMVLILSIVAR